MLMECRVSSNVRFGQKTVIAVLAMTNGDLPNSPLSLTTLPLCCVVTIDAQSTKTNKRAILTQIQNFFLSLSSNTSLITPNPSSRGSKLHLTFTAHFARCSFFSGLPFVSQSCITDRKKNFCFPRNHDFKRNRCRANKPRGARIQF